MISDEISISTLKTIAQARLGPAASELPPAPELRVALAAAFGGFDLAPVSESDLARAALDLLRQDPAFAELVQFAAIRAADAPSSRQRYVEPLTIGVVTAALLVLQTRVRFKLDHEGKWSIEIDKKSLNDPAVKFLVQRLLPFLGKVER